MWKNFNLVLILLCTWKCKADDSYAIFVDVSVYYESLCPDSIKFIVEQLYPVYKVIGEPIRLTMVPYGFATTIVNDGKLEFKCQHGPKECYGNLIHACAISLFHLLESTTFIYCSMTGDPSNTEVLKECAENTNISWRSVEDCYNSGEASKLLAANGNLTRQVFPPIKFIPTIIFNNKFNQNLQDEALLDFGRVVCKLMNYQPDNCIKK